ncbi:hypothetical protein F01_440215 [Burkholderia cenocepacia]|nr:hypothetical protein F01_440215 [Burkholderia cenocepacia]
MPAFDALPRVEFISTTWSQSDTTIICRCSESGCRTGSRGREVRLPEVHRSVSRQSAGRRSEAARVAPERHRTDRAFAEAAVAIKRRYAMQRRAACHFVDAIRASESNC